MWMEKKAIANNKQSTAALTYKHADSGSQSTCNRQRFAIGAATRRGNCHKEMTSKEDTTINAGGNADPPAIEPLDAAPARPQPQSQPQSPVQLRQPLISNVLRGALFSAKDRSFIIGLEQDLIAFITSHTDSYLLRPMNSYYRLLTHQTAEYYGLGHTLNKEGNSIVVFKNFGGESSPPVPLVSLPFEPQLMAMTQQRPQQQQQHFMYPQGAAPGAAPGQGPAPIGYGYAPQYAGYPQTMPFGQQQQQPFNNKYGGNRYQPRHFNGNKQHHRQNNHQNNEQPNTATTDSTEGTDETTPTSTTTTTTQIKLMKRTDEEDADVESAAPASKDEDVPVDSAPKKDAETIANERATRESEYQKARERIFQGDDGIDEDLIDDMENLSMHQHSPNLPRSLPSQPQHPYGGGYIPANMAQQMAAGGVPPQYYYNQGYPQMMYDPSAYGQQPVYYNQMNYNSGGYRKKNYNNGYRNNRSNNYGGNNYNNYNSNRNGGQSDFREKEAKAETEENTEVEVKSNEQDDNSAPKEEANGEEVA